MPTLKRVPMLSLGHKYADISFIMAQSALRCSLLVRTCSCSNGSDFATLVAAGSAAGLVASIAGLEPGFGRWPCASFLCSGEQVNTRMPWCRGCRRKLDDRRPGRLAARASGWINMAMSHVRSLNRCHRREKLWKASMAGTRQDDKRVFAREYLDSRSHASHVV